MVRHTSRLHTHRYSHLSDFYTAVSHPSYFTSLVHTTLTPRVIMGVGFMPLDKTPLVFTLPMLISLCQRKDIRYKSRKLEMKKADRRWSKLEMLQDTHGDGEKLTRLKALITQGEKMQCECHSLVDKRWRKVGMVRGIHKGCRTAADRPARL